MMASKMEPGDSAWTKTLKCVPAITQSSIEEWAEKSAKVPRSQQKKGYSNFAENYIHDVEVKASAKGCFLRGKCFPSMRKNIEAYSLKVELTSPFNVKESDCTCKAGRAECNHLLGLLYTVAHFQKLDLKVIPLHKSKTSMPQTWHLPSRIDGMVTRPIENIEVRKMEPKTEKTPKLKRKIDCIQSTLYCPVEKIPYVDFAKSLFENLSQAESNSQFQRLMTNVDVNNVNTSESKFGHVPVGSVLSYQQKLTKVDTGDIINDVSAPPRPCFLTNTVSQQVHVSLTKGQADVYEGLKLSTDEASEIEVNTREQSACSLWHRLRACRLTSTVFKQICSRQKDFDKLAYILVSKKRVLTKAMQHGLLCENTACECYADATKCNIYKCGFVICPSCPYLGASPDRVVFDTTTRSWGLLEVKCPQSHSIVELAYLKLSDNNYSLKKTHDYYFQVMGQMAMTGMPWCDFFVWCQSDYHLERIHFDLAKWGEIQCKLDIFYFTHFLPLHVK